MSRFQRKRPPKRRSIKRPTGIGVPQRNPRFKRTRRKKVLRKPPRS